MNHKSFCIKRGVGYREIIVNNRIFNKFYELENLNGQEIISIPDGCIDIEFVWKDNMPEAYVCGCILNGKISGIANYDKCFGMRFHPGYIPECFKKEMNTIINSRRRLEDFMDVSEMIAVLSQDLTFKERVDYFINYFEKQVKIEPNMIATLIMKRVKEESGYLNITNLVNTTGYSHCYIDRVFKNNVGLSVKKYASIIRLQQAIEIVRENKENEIYDRLGFYDQAHFIHEFKRFTLITPTVLLKMKEIEIV
jgi:AraC-type DNA-binding domain-containing proteins